MQYLTWNAISNNIKKRELVGIKHSNDPKAFIEYSNDMQEDYWRIKSRKKT